MAARKKPAKKIKRTSTPTKMTAATKRKIPAKKPSSAKKLAKPSTMKAGGHITVGRSPYTKSEFISTLVSQTGLAKKEITSVLETITRVIAAHLHKQGPEIFSWPGLFKMKVVKKPATKARQGISPFTGESMVFKAKPASRRVKILPLKQLKDMAAH